MEPQKQIAPKNLESMNYIGPSMNPTFKPGDRLEIISCEAKKIRRGDVIVFIPPGNHSKVVHRVVRIDSHGIKTRGDSCNHLDEWVLSPDCILGRVILARRGNKKWRVSGGRMGQVFASIVRAIHAIDSGVSSLLRPTYDRLAKSGVFRKILPMQMKKMVISFNRPEGLELQLLMGRRVIGRWLPGTSRWHIRRPFRLFVDEASLPGNPARGSVVRSPSSVVDEV
jgi:signal peptidase